MLARPTGRWRSAARPVISRTPRGWMRATVPGAMPRSESEGDGYSLRCRSTLRRRCGRLSGWWSPVVREAGETLRRATIPHRASAHDRRLSATASPIGGIAACHASRVTRPPHRPAPSLSLHRAAVRSVIISAPPGATVPAAINRLSWPLQSR